MSTDIVKRSAPLPEQSLDSAVQFAKLLSDADLLPKQFVGKPANVLYAVEYGRTLGITPVAAITGIHVIEGKPSASSGLIGALVRQAGHKLRVRSDGMSTATAQIVRADDPEFTYECTWTLERAAQAGLCEVKNGKPWARDRNGKPTAWEKYTAAMLKARAITEVARDACEDVLFGLHYTPEELGALVNQDGEPVEATVQQLRRVEPGTDQWSTPAPEQIAPSTPAAADAEPVEPHPPAQEIADQAEKAKDKTRISQLWAMAKTGRLMQAPVRAADTQEIDELGQYLTRRAKHFADAESTETVHDAEIVNDEDDYAAAVAELRAAAEAARLDDFEDGAAQALGCPIADASTEAIRDLAAKIRPAA